MRHASKNIPRLSSTDSKVIEKAIYRIVNNEGRLQADEKTYNLSSGDSTTERALVLVPTFTVTSTAQNGTVSANK